jgi:hypothetical protein
MRGGKIDVRTTDLVLDDKPVEDMDAPPAVTPAIAPPPSRPAGEPGRWRTSRTPFLREIMDCLSLSSPWTRRHCCLRVLQHDYGLF